jgi:uncharacterized membrane protein/glutaredoxin
MTITKEKWLHLVLAVLGIGMAGISTYLTQHYYQVLFPEDLNVGSFCDISRFWNCDNATFSPLGSILNIPTSLFGVAFGLIIVFGSLIRTSNVIKTNFFLSIINLVACIFLFGYSLLFLHGLCPGCTVYYVLSLGTVVVFIFLRPPSFYPQLAVLLSYSAFIIFLMGGAYLYNFERFNQQEEIYAGWAKEFRRSPVMDESQLNFDFPLVKSTNNFMEAPLRITIFSDFQCPFCKILGDELQKISNYYEGKINIRYLFYPLDASCNDQVKTFMHPLACKAARLSYCAKDNFLSVHNQIYDNQERLSNDWLSQKAKALKISECYESEKTIKAVKEIVNSSDAFNIEAAPTIFINGRKISGLVPTKALMVLLDSLLTD